MTTLNQIRSEWNALVPAAQAQGLRGVHILRSNHETLAKGHTRLAWLRSQLSSTTSSTPVVDIEGWTFGVEVEFLLPVATSVSTLAREVAAAGVECHGEMYNHGLRNWWKIVTDISVTNRADGRSTPEQGLELVSPPLRGVEGFAQIEKVCAVLGRLGARINTTCGLHVHIGARNEQLGFFKNLITLYERFQGVIDTTLPVSRRDNTYCRPISILPAHLTSARSVADVARAISQTPDASRDGTRYKKLNLKSFWAHGTVEFRHHSGTVEATKVIEWVKLVIGLCAAARTGSHPEAQVNVAGLAALTSANAAYFAGRHARFAGRA